MTWLFSQAVWILQSKFWYATTDFSVLVCEKIKSFCSQYRLLKATHLFSTNCNILACNSSNWVHFITKCISSSTPFFRDNGVNLKVWVLTKKWGGWRHRIAKLWGKKGDFSKSLQRMGGKNPQPHGSDVPVFAERTYPFFLLYLKFRVPACFNHKRVVTQPKFYITDSV